MGLSLSRDAGASALHSHAGAWERGKNRLYRFGFQMNAWLRLVIKGAIQTTIIQINLGHRKFSQEVS